jgi:cell division protein FtsB
MKNLLLRWGGIVALSAFIALFFALRIPHGTTRLKQKNEQIRRLQQENADLMKRNAERRERIRRLREDRNEQELAVRERLKYQRQGETSIVVPK